MIEIRPFFASLIAFAVNRDHHLLEKKLTKKCLQLKKKIKKGGDNWVSNRTYNTLSTYSIVDQKDFLPIQNFITDAVISYSNKTKIDITHLNPRPHEGWFNVYNKYDYQEYHIHGSSTLSTIYFLNADRGHAKVAFKSPVNEMSRIKYKEHEDLTYKQMFVEPVPGMCIIFDSSLEHAVEQHLLDTPRITLAYNYKDMI
jgi:uncharacterized protein (TIGR02466 family)|tara:strand:- start:43 stop:639 length:597 start_codon:yes stop_codon:yes gene_type:complete